MQTLLIIQIITLSSFGGLSAPKDTKIYFQQLPGNVQQCEEFAKGINMLNTKTIKTTYQCRPIVSNDYGRAK